MADPVPSVSVGTGLNVVTASAPVFTAAENDLFCALGQAVPIASRPGPTQIVLKQPWPVASLVNEQAFSILSLGEYWRNAISINQRLVDLLAKWEVVSPFKFDAAGTLSERDNYNNQPRGFVYIATDQLPVRMYIKLANTNSSADWSLAIYIGSGGQVEFQEALDQERQQRTQADAALSQRIDDIAAGADPNVRRDLNAEITRSTGKDSQHDSQIAGLRTDLTAEGGARASADAALGGRVDAEVSARTSADIALGGRLDTETNARLSADALLGTQISNEATTRAAADTQLGQRATLLETFRDNAVLALSNLSRDIATEADLRQKGDEAGRFGFGDIYGLITPLPVLDPATGAQPSKIPDGRTMGAFIAKGGTGSGATVEYRYKVDPSGLPSFNARRVRQGLTINVNSEFARNLIIGLNTLTANGTIRSVQLESYKSTRLFPTQIFVEFIFVTIGDEVAFSPYARNLTAAASPQDDYWTLVAATATIIGTPSGTTTIADENLAVALALGDGRVLDAAKSLVDAERAQRLLAEKALAAGFGEVYSRIVSLPQLSSPTGAFPSTIADGRVMGAYIIKGGSGANALVESRFPFNDQKTLTLPGREIELIAAFNVNAEFSRNLVVGLNTVTTSGQVRSVAPLTYQSLRPFPTLIIVILSFITIGDETAISPYAINQTPVAQPQDDYWTLSFLAGRIVTSNSLLTTVAQENALLAADSTVSRAATKAQATAVNLVSYGGAVYAKEVTVRADGTGQYLSPVQANAAITDASLTNKYLINIGPGTYDTISGGAEWMPQGFVHLRGTGSRRTVLSARQPASTSLTLIKENSAARTTGETSISGAKFEAENARYAYHPEASGANPNIVNRISDCEFIHLGNDTAVAYQQSNGGNPNGVWSSQHGLGGGGASGQIWEFVRTLFQSKNEVAFYFHDNADFAKPMTITHRNCRMISLAPRVPGVNCGSLWLDSLGSGVMNQCELNGVEMNAPIIMGFQPRCSLRPEMQLADSVSWDIIGADNSPVPFLMFDDGARALVITSADTANASPVTLGTSATSALVIAALFGEVRTRRGGGGAAAAIEGTRDVGKHPVGPLMDQYITHMGYRLGDRRSSPWTLPVTANGVTKTLTFDQDYRAVENQPIIDAINATLTTSCAIASLVWVADRYRPHFHDQELLLRNVSSVAIPQKYGTAFSGSSQDIRLATSADAASLFAGIALERILPGEMGRIKRRGVSAVWMDVARSAAGDFAFGDALGIGPVPGMFVKNAAIPLLKCRNAIDVEWGL